MSNSSCMEVGLKAGNMNLRGAYFHIKVSPQCPRILNLDAPSLLISSMESESLQTKLSAFETVT